MFILGPTSSGKTSVAIKLCREFNGEIVSADSRQVYKYLDIGTGKVPVGVKDMQIGKLANKDEPVCWEVDGVKVWMYDVVKPGEYFSAADFRELAEGRINDIWLRGKIPFVVGGTGFYIETLLGSKNLAIVVPNFKLRDNLEKLSAVELADKLRLLDLKRYEVIDKNNRRRLIRAVEIASSLGTASTPQSLRVSGWRINQPLRLGLAAPHDFLYPRVDAWVEDSFRGGLVKETAGLIKMGFKNTPQLQGLIYRTVLQHLAGSLKLEETKQLIKYDLHSYIRRQETYFRKMADIKWLHIDSSAFDEELHSSVKSYLNG